MKLTDLIKETIKEDIPTFDVTSSLLIDPLATADAQIIAKESGLFFGTPIIHALNTLLDSVDIQATISDGDHVQPSNICVTLSGNLKQIIESERTLLNFLQRLSGISTTTHAFVSALNDPNIQVLDTRKTTPLFRSLEKEAVSAGGGFNHRFGLHDMILVKENHLQLFFKKITN